LFDPLNPFFELICATLVGNRSVRILRDFISLSQWDGDDPNVVSFRMLVPKLDVTPGPIDWSEPF
jgi:hypothetical protein